MAEKQALPLGTDPHADDPNEDPEQHLGAVIPDPWDDPDQKDWETVTVDLDPETRSV